MYQGTIFYDSIYDALEKGIALSGKSKKEIASALYPGRVIETARSLLSRAMSPENQDVHLSIEMVLSIMKSTRPDDVLCYLCDEFGFNRPVRKTKEGFQNEIKTHIKDIQDKMSVLIKEVSQLQNLQEAL